jgi:hypothetical protein
MIGVRDVAMDLTSRVAATLNDLISRNLTNKVLSFFDVVTMHAAKKIDFALMEELRSADGGCLCSYDPNQTCPMHTCGCGCSAGETCKWRERALDWMSMHKIDVADKHNTYIDCIEAAGLPGPSSPRERHLLSVVAKELAMKVRCLT